MEGCRVMKIERLMAILTVLQQNKKVTAPYLAEKFEVSRRTINRDIEDLCRAGIPIVTTQGSQGGIALMEGFCLDTTVFTKRELAAVFTGLRTLDSVSRFSRAERIAEKFGGKDTVGVSDGMVIDLASFYKEDLADKIEKIQRAVRERRCISFYYCCPKGEGYRTVEPYLVVFRWSDWYVYGFHPERQGFRMYKLRRLWELSVGEEYTEVREMPAEQERFGSHMKDDYMVAAVYDASVKYRLVEEYGPRSFTVMEDGRLYARWGFADMEAAAAWFLGFGDRVTVVEPPGMVERMADILRRTAEKYAGT